MSTAIINCSIVDVRAGVIVPGQSIFIEQGSIDKIVVSGLLPAVDETIDANGAFVIPGLIDMHVHACGDPLERLAEAPGRSSSQTCMGIQAAENLRTALAAGVTTVRDMGGGPVAPYDTKHAWMMRLFAGARPLVAGPILTAVGGHGMEHGLQLGVEVCGPDEMRRAVRTAVMRGSDVIKVATSSVATRTELTLEELMAAVEEAHWCGLKVASHANFGLRGINNSIESGCDSIEHGCAADRKALEEMRSRNIALCPTITVLSRIRERADVYGQKTPALTDAVQRAWRQHEKMVQQAIELGVAIVAGTDAGMPAVGFDSLVKELEWLVSWGMSPLDALRAATCAASELLGRDDLGLVAPGCSADLVLLGGNPLANLSALTDILAVMLEGRIMRRSPNLEPAAPGAN